MSGRVNVQTVTDANGQEPLPAAPAVPTPGSIVARLRERARAQQTTRYTELAVGGEFEDRLWIKYGVLSPDEMDRFVATRAGVRIQDLSATSATMDMMSRACQCLIGRYGDEEEVLEDEYGPVKLEDRLARLLDLAAPDEPKLSSHEVINRLFGRNGAAITRHGDELTEWMTSPSTAASEPVGEH
jgi:hypothetical protein